MFEKEAENYADKQIGCGDGYYEWTDVKQSFKQGAEFGYNFAKEEIDYLNKHWRSEEESKANEWHFVKDEGTPKVEGHYLVCLRNKDRDVFDCWIYHDEDVGWYCMKVRMKDIYAWKEIVLPELKESK